MGWIMGITCYLMMLLMCSSFVNIIIGIFFLKGTFDLDKADHLTNPIGWIFGFIFIIWRFFAEQKKNIIIYVSDSGITIEDLALNEIIDIVSKFDDVVFEKRPKFVFSYLDVKDKFTLRGDEYIVELGPWEFDWWISPVNEQKINKAAIKDLGHHIKQIASEKYNYVNNRKRK